MRLAVLAVALAFTCLVAVLTALDIAHHGVNWLDALAIAIVVLFATGIVGALLTPDGRRRR